MKATPRQFFCTRGDASVQREIEPKLFRGNFRGLASRNLALIGLVAIVSLAAVITRIKISMGLTARRKDRLREP